MKCYAQHYILLCQRHPALLYINQIYLSLPSISTIHSCIYPSYPQTSIRPFILHLFTYLYHPSLLSIQLSSFPCLSFFPLHIYSTIHPNNASFHPFHLSIPFTITTIHSPLTSIYLHLPFLYFYHPTNTIHPSFYPSFPAIHD